MHNDFSVSFIVYGHKDVDQLTDAVGLLPTRAVRKGDPYSVGTTSIPHIPQSIWEIGHDDTMYDDVEQSLEALLKLLLPHASQITDATAECRCVFAISTRSKDENIELDISAQSIKNVESLHASIWFDAYRAND